MKTIEELKAREIKLNMNISKYIPFGQGGGYYYKKTVAEILEESNAEDFDVDLESIKVHYIVRVFYENQPQHIIEYFDWIHKNGKIIFFSLNRNLSDYDLELNLTTETPQLLKEMERHFSYVETQFELVNNEYHFKVA